MREPSSFDLDTAFAIFALVVFIPLQAGAFPGAFEDWQARYAAISPSGDAAGCQLCHEKAGIGRRWNGYGWDFLNARLNELPGVDCDLGMDGSVSNDEAFFCIEALDSDADPSRSDNVTEIGLGTQPGWTLYANNTIYTETEVLLDQLPPDDIVQLDPDGTEPPPPEPPGPPVDPEPPSRLRKIQVVKPGDSIQAAIDRAMPGGKILILPGTYRELADRINGLHISRSLRLIGLSTRTKRVVFANAGNQRNGVVVVPEERADCMSCHSDLAPPFPIHPGVKPGLKMREPMIRDIVIRGITIRGFRNNGLFTENVDGFKIVDVESIDNRNYGIFPTLSKNGLITRSRAVGSDLDSGIWVETSENVLVTHNLAEGNVNGFEVSNSDDIVLALNESRNNTVGAAILLLPDLFDDRAGAKRIDLRGNWIHDNNRPNTARPDSILSLVPSGTGVLYLGVDKSTIAGNWIENNDFTGIVMVDYCAAVMDTPFDCFTGSDPSITPEFLADQAASGNTAVKNVLRKNGTNPGSDNPFAFAAADLTLLTTEDNGNCYANNVFMTFFSTLGILPPCP